MAAAFGGGPVTAAILALTAVGLLTVQSVARKAVGAAVAWWTVAALLFATSLWPTLLSGSRVGVVAATTFALASMAVRLGSSAHGLLPRLGAAAVWLSALALPHVVAGHVPAPTPIALGEALFSSPKGLFFWSPILWLGVFGWVRIATEDGVRGAWAAGALAFTTLTAAGPGAAGPMAGGRLHAALPILALGLARAFAWIRDVVERHPAAPLAVAGGALTVWNFLFMEQYRTDRIPRDLPVSFADVSEGNAALLARAVGSPNAWPVNWLFAWRHRVTPAKYDVVVGQGPWPAGFVAIDDPRLDPAVLADGWGGRERCDGVPCRRIAGVARMLVSLTPGSSAPSAVRVSGSGVVSIGVNGGRPMVRSLGPAATDLPLQGAAVWREGVNEITLWSALPEGAAALGLSFGPAGER